MANSPYEDPTSPRQHDDDDDDEDDDADDEHRAELVNTADVPTPHAVQQVKRKPSNPSGDKTTGRP